jgi:hypothetical protein
MVTDFWARRSGRGCPVVSRVYGSKETVVARRASPPSTTLEVRVTFEPSRLSPACVAQGYEQVVPLTHRPASRASHRGLAGRENAVQPVGRRAAS